MLSLAELAALLLTGLAGGVLADAVDRRLLLRITEAALLGGTLLLLVNSLIGQPRLWVLFAVSFLLAGLDGIQRPSLDSLVPRLVPPDQVAATSALMAVRSEFGMIAAPALSGVLIAVSGVATAYAVDAATFGVSLVCLWMMGAAPPPPEGAELSLKAVSEGLRYAVSRKDLLGLVPGRRQRHVLRLPERPVSRSWPAISAGPRCSDCCTPRPPSARP